MRLVASLNSSRLGLFIRVHRYGSALLALLIGAKATLMVLSPLSEDFLTTGVLAAEIDAMTILKGDGAYVLWMLLVRAMYCAWRIVPIAHPLVESMTGFWYFVPSLSSNLLIFMLKLPLLIFDIMCGYVVSRLCLSHTASRHLAYVAFMLWMVNPYLTIVTEMFGAYDVIVVFFLLVSIFLFDRKKVCLSAVLLAVSAAFKPYSLLLFPAFTLSLVRGGRARQAAKFTGVLALLGLVGPVLFIASGATPQAIADLFSYYFVKGGTFFQSFVLRSETSEFLKMAMSLTFTLLTVCLAFMYGLWKISSENLLDSSFALCLTFLVFSFWHPQMLIWTIPFITLDYCINRTSKIYPTVFFLTAFAFEFVYFSFYFTSHGHSFMFIPNYTAQISELSRSTRSLYESNSALIIANIARSVFSGVCIYYLVRIFLRNIDLSRINAWRKI